MNYTLKHLSLFLLFCMLLGMSCYSKEYNVHYFPLEMDVYIPLSRHEILKNGISFKIRSENINSLFSQILNQESIRPDYEDFLGLRILIIDNNGEEIFITQDKHVISLSRNMIYEVDSKTLEAVLNEFSRYLKKNKIYDPANFK